MRILPILILFLLCTAPVFAQTDTLDINGKLYLGDSEGQVILNHFSVNGVCHTLTSTPNGKYLSVRTFDNQRIVFLFVNNKLQEIKHLKNYQIWGYTSKLNSLIIGLNDQRSKKISGGDVSTSTISTYDINTKNIKVLVDYSINGFSGIYKVSVTDETVTCVVNVKKKNGSDFEKLTTIIK